LEELITLLEKFWILREQDKETYYHLKDKEEVLKPFLEEQFVLSEITEYIQSLYPGEEQVDWTLYQHRRCLVRALKFVREMGMMRINDGEEEGFSASQDTEVLYESTGVSRYFYRYFIQTGIGRGERRAGHDSSLQKRIEGPAGGWRQYNRLPEGLHGNGKPSCIRI
jgi:hypothetical protein